MLYNYENIDKLIDERKSSMINHIDVGASAWNKSKTQLKGYTLEDIVEEFDNDQRIQRFCKWKTF